MDYLVSLSIGGCLPSLKNQRRIVTNRRTGKPMSIKSQNAMDYEALFMLKVPREARIGYDGPVSLKVRVWYPSRRNDLDIEYLCDLLQRAGIIKNDRQIFHKECWKGLDRNNPRVIFSVYEFKEMS